MISYIEALDPGHGVADGLPVIRQQRDAAAAAHSMAVQLQRLRLPEAAQLDLHGAVLPDGEADVVPPGKRSLY